MGPSRNTAYGQVFTAFSDQLDLRSITDICGLSKGTPTPLFSCILYIFYYFYYILGLPTHGHSVDGAGSLLPSVISVATDAPPASSPSPHRPTKIPDIPSWSH